MLQVATPPFHSQKDLRMIQFLHSSGSRFVLASLLALGSLGMATAPAHAAAPMVKTQAAGYYRMMLGAFEVTALSDGTVAMPADKLLHAPAAKIKAGLSRNFQSSLVEMSVNSWLINTGSRLVLIDAGAGNLYGPTLGRLTQQIQAAGYQPEQIDDIFITHMHPDHVGGLMVNGTRAFANATVHADQREADFWLSTANAEAAPAEMKGSFQGAIGSLNPYIAAGRFAPFKEQGEVVPGVRAWATLGHTAGHTSYVVESEGKRLVVIGDLIHVAAMQLDEPSITVGFDADVKAAAATRAKVFSRLAKDGTLVGAAHISFPGMGHLRAAGKGWQWVPVVYNSQFQ